MEEAITHHTISIFPTTLRNNNMPHPRTKTITIDQHDESVPLVRLRFVEIDGTLVYVAKDVGAAIGLRADDDGDYRQTLQGYGVNYLMSVVSDRGNISGPLALITDAAYRQLSEAVRQKQDRSTVTLAAEVTA